MLKTDRQLLVESKPESIRSLYDKYAGMLLGYVFEIVKDRTLADECLLRIFTELSAEYGVENFDGPRNWAQLQRFAKVRLTPFAAVSIQAAENADAPRRSDDQQLSALSAEQEKVFLDAYYYGKTVGMLATELNKTEEFIRKTLREAFAILKTSGEN